MTFTLQAVITITIMLATFLEHIAPYSSKIPTLAEKTAQAVKSTITKASRNRLFQNIKDSYKTAALAITIATNMRAHTSHNEQTHKNNRNTQNYPGMRKINDEYDGSYQSHTTRTQSNSGN